MMQRGITPTTMIDEEKWRPLLAYWVEHEVLRKNKQLFSQALSCLENWILKCYMQRRESRLNHFTIFASKNDTDDIEDKLSDILAKSFTIEKR